MGVVVFDSDVLIGFLSGHDQNHTRAVKEMRDALKPGTRRLVSAVNYSEILIGPLQAGTQGQVDAMLVKFGIEIVPVDSPLAQRAATVRARTKLRLPDAFAVATAIHAERRGWGATTLASFDKKVRRARAELGY